jgi:hypothetical protein
MNIPNMLYDLERKLDMLLTREGIEGFAPDTKAEPQVRAENIEAGIEAVVKRRGRPPKVASAD